MKRHEAIREFRKAIFFSQSVEHRVNLSRAVVGGSLEEMGRCLKKALPSISNRKVKASLDQTLKKLS